MKHFLLLAALLPLMASAQVRKCQDAAGNISYGDVCNKAVRETTVNTGANTIDTSGLRAEGQQLQDRQELQGLLANPPVQCRFKAYVYGDKKGQALRQDATRECVQNILAAKQGLPPQLTAYQMWKDHFDQTSAQRRAIGAQINATENARAIAESNERAIQRAGQRSEQAIRDASDRAQNRTYTCRPNGLNSDLTCR